MSVGRYIMHQKLSDGSYEDVYCKSESGLIYRPNGRTVEQDLEAYLPRTQSTDDVPQSLEPGQIVIGYTRMFYGSGSGVVTILNAADVADIATAEQTITWNRYNAVSVYHWGKYTISTTTSYRNELEQIAQGETIRGLPTAGDIMNKHAYFFNSYTINTSNGTITLTGRVESYEDYYGSAQDARNCYIDSLENTHMARDTVTSNQVIKIARYSVANSKGRSDGTYKVASTTTQGRGSYVGDVTSETNTAYPDNGISGSNWYVRGNTTYRQGTYVDQVTSRVETAYPTNGYQDGYWYVLVS